MAKPKGLVVAPSGEGPWRCPVCLVIWKPNTQSYLLCNSISGADPKTIVDLAEDDHKKFLPKKKW